MQNSRRLFQDPYGHQQVLDQGPGDGINNAMGRNQNDLDSSAVMSVLSERQIMSFRSSGKLDTNMEMINELKKYKL